MDSVGFPQGPELAEGTLSMTQGCTARREGFEHNFCPCGLGFCLGSDGKICYLNTRPLALAPSPTYHPDSCFNITVLLESPVRCEGKGC